MKTKTAIKRAGGKLPLGNLLGIDRRSIQKWTENVPSKREDQLRELKPEWFAKRGKDRVKQ